MKKKIRKLFQRRKIENVETKLKKNNAINIYFEGGKIS
jgi:hypothetical protein